ncbi:MAG TPA: metallophosphoesterase family protein [Bacilli bacterium]
MRLGVVSDTHMYNYAQQLPKALVKGLQGVELIIHAGDWVGVNIATLFEQIAPVEGVAGNNDGEEIIQRFGRKKLLTLSGFKIGLVHGDGYKKTTEMRAFDAFHKDKPDMILFGHSHTPFAEYHQGVFMFNPGSPTDKRKEPQYSYGIVDLDKTISARHFYYSDKQ